MHVTDLQEIFIWFFSFAFFFKYHFKTTQPITLKLLSDNRIKNQCLYKLFLRKIGSVLC